jgi:hypoxanthine phosphoribosyltransferase
MSETIQILDKKFKPYLSEELIQERIAVLAKEIEEDYKNKEVHFICVLNGSLFFASDLIKEYRYICQLHTVRCKSYVGTKSSGTITMIQDFNEEIKGKEVILLEDIIDTGHTLNFLLERIKLYHPKTVKIASLLAKPDALQHPIEVDYLGFQIPNLFVLGYGLDYNGYGRNLKDIYQLAQ